MMSDFNPFSRQYRARSRGAIIQEIGIDNTAVVAMTAVLSIPISWMIAPRLRARYWSEKGLKSDIISGPNFESPL